MSNNSWFGTNSKPARTRGKKVDESLNSFKKLLNLRINSFQHLQLHCFWRIFLTHRKVTFKNLWLSFDRKKRNPKSYQLYTTKNTFHTLVLLHLKNIHCRESQTLSFCQPLFRDLKASISFFETLPIPSLFLWSKKVLSFKHHSSSYVTISRLSCSSSLFFKYHSPFNNYPYAIIIFTQEYDYYSLPFEDNYVHAFPFNLYITELSNNYEHLLFK